MDIFGEFVSMRFDDGVFRARLVVDGWFGHVLPNYFLNTILINPFNSDAIMPHATSSDAILIRDLPFAVLLPVFPIAFEFAAVGPEVCPVSFFFVVDVRADVCAAVGPGVRSLSIHFTVLK